MKVLFVGDIVGRGGRNILRQKLGQTQERHQIDFTIVNVENAAGGFGVSPSQADDFLNQGADVLTSGNHIWDRKEIFDYLAGQHRLLRPGNYPPGLPGRHCCIAQSRHGVTVAVVNLQGRVFMPIIDCPFQLIDRELPRIRDQADVVIVDFHAEATSEKMAFGWYLDGRVSAVVGTHTHVPTADARILHQGTAYVTDVGMTGSYESVIGMKVEGSLQRFLTGTRTRFEPATNSPRFCSVVIEVDESTGKALSIERCDVQ